MKKERINVIGAGPASLVASINLAKNGYEVIVNEMKTDVGTRYNNNYQCIENWSTGRDVRDFPETIGITNNFRFEPCANGDFFNPSGEKYHFNISRPLLYIVERGLSEWSLDQSLKRQALESGVHFEWGNFITHVPQGKVIIGTGHKAVDAIQHNIVFKTNHKNYYAVFLDNEIAPQGYAILLVNNGKGTLTTCMFDKLDKASSYFDKAEELMKDLIKIDVINPKSSWENLNFFMKMPLIKDNRIYFVGETAGIQDAFLGLGLRDIMYSGYLAAKSIIEDLSYTKLYRKYLLPKMEASLVNRWMYSRLENTVYTFLLDRLRIKEDVNTSFRKQYRLSSFKKALLPVAKRSVKLQMVDKQCHHEDCSCIWCEHGEKHSMKEAC